MATKCMCGWSPYKNFMAPNACVDGLRCGDIVLRQFNYHQPIPRSPPTRQHIHSVHRGRFNENWIVKQADFISVWEERHAVGRRFELTSKQPPMYDGNSSSQPAYTDDGGYIPQMDYTSITGSSFHHEQMHGTPLSMQVADQ
ncbi:hypothetical protein V6N11_021823 [Hibiscus sabdariffa]|uniref:Uncharacterized protein n=1 Tax=Hibiscus sabdariffa TaxID=183260 RepID=A0ABR2THD0_9ROSI